MTELIEDLDQQLREIEQAMDDIPKFCCVLRQGFSGGEEIHCAEPVVAKATWVCSTNLNHGGPRYFCKGHLERLLALDMTCYHCRHNNNIISVSRPKHVEFL